MNFRRAIYRLWLVVSAIWVGGVLLLSSLDGELARDTVPVLGIAIVPPMLLLILIAALGWVIAGLFGSQT